MVHRARRILPPYWICYLLVVLRTWALGALVHSQGWDLHRLVSQFFTRGFWMCFLLVISGYSSFWTLVVEARWYFVFPVLISVYFAVKNPLYRGLAVLAVALLAREVYIVGVGQGRYPWADLLFAGMPLWLPLFGLGIYAAHLVATAPEGRLSARMLKTLPWALALSALIVVIGRPVSPRTGWERLFLWGPFFFLLLLCGLQNLRIKRILEWRPLVLVGAFSYSLYLTHLPLIRAVRVLTGSELWNQNWRFVFYQAAVAPACIAFAYLFYLCAEKPFLRRRILKADAGQPS